MDEWHIEWTRAGTDTLVKATHLRSGCVGLGDTREEAIAAALANRDAILEINPTAQMEVDVDEPEIVSFGPFMALKLWTEAQGEPQPGAWCDECQMSTAASLVVNIGSGTRIFQRVEVTHCMMCHNTTRKELDG